MLSTKAPTFDLKTFTFNGHTLRTVQIDGKPWLVVSDVLGAIGVHRHSSGNYRNHMGVGEWQTIRLADFKCLPKLQAAIFPRIATGQRATILSLVTESGLYKIVLRAQRISPAARDFQDWVTNVVLPGIRRDGAVTRHHENPSIYFKTETSRAAVAPMSERS